MKEATIQKAVADFLQWTLKPPYWFSAIGHGGGGKVRGAQLKAMGLKPGIADFLVRGPRLPVLWIEMKTDTGRQSIPQKHFEIDMTSLGDQYALCRSVQAVQHVIDLWKNGSGARRAA